jgi:hypothetical protein
VLRHPFDGAAAVNSAAAFLVRGVASCYAGASRHQPSAGREEEYMDILIPDIGVAEKTGRSIVVDAFLLLAFRLAGKRPLGRMTALDLVNLLVIRDRM